MDELLKIPLQGKRTEIVQKLMRSLTLLGGKEVRPVEMRKLCEDMGFQLGKHHDSLEFLEEVFHLISNEIPELTLTRSTLYAGLSDLVYSKRSCFYLTVPNNDGTSIQFELENAIKEQYAHETHYDEGVKTNYVFDEAPKAVLIAIDRVAHEKNQTLKTENRILIDKYLTIKFKDGNSRKYVLGGAIIHGGNDFEIGHYYVCIYKTCDSSWYKLNDDRVFLQME